jgi:hypothetical protein
MISIDECRCPCHSMPGAVHCVPCCSGTVCSPLDSLDELLIVEEYIKRQKNETTDSVLSEKFSRVVGPVEVVSKNEKKV